MDESTENIDGLPLYGDRIGISWDILGDEAWDLGQKPPNYQEWRILYTYIYICVYMYVYIYIPSGKLT